MTPESYFFHSPLSGLPLIRPGVSSKRESSYDRSGGNKDFYVVAPGETKLLAEAQGTGSVKHIWMTIRCYDEQYLRKVSLEMFWDGEDCPSVRVPVGDFFGIGHAVASHFTSLPLVCTFGDRRGPKGPFSAAMNCYFPMPFARGAKIQIVNEAEKSIENLFFYIDFEMYADGLPENIGRFHAAWNRENPCRKIVHQQAEENPAQVPAPWDLAGINLSGDDNYVILDAEGEGQYVGCVLSIDNFDASNQAYTWPGEGDDMIFIDGELWPPSLHGTGTEDYFGMAWGFPPGQHSTPITEFRWAATCRNTSESGACTASTSTTRSISANPSKLPLNMDTPTTRATTTPVPPTGTREGRTSPCRPCRRSKIA